MITRIPALEFMQNIIGAYKTNDGSVNLKIIRCGYGMSLELWSDSRLQVAGVIGAAGKDIEFYAQVGLPNIVRLVGHKSSNNSIVFTGDELPITLTLNHEGGVVTATIRLQGETKVSHVVYSA